MNTWVCVCECFVYERDTGQVNKLMSINNPELKTAPETIVKIVTEVVIRKCLVPQPSPSLFRPVIMLCWHIGICVWVYTIHIHHCTTVRLLDFYCLSKLNSEGSWFVYPSFINWEYILCSGCKSDLCVWMVKLEIKNIVIVTEWVPV